MFGYLCYILCPVGEALHLPGYRDCHHLSLYYFTLLYVQYEQVVLLILEYVDVVVPCYRKVSTIQDHWVPLTDPDQG